MIIKYIYIYILSSSEGMNNNININSGHFEINDNLIIKDS